MGVIVFDWSGTLCDNREQFYRVYQRIFEHCGRPKPSEKWLYNNYTSPYMQFWNTHVPELTHEREAELYTRFMAEEPDASPYPGVKAVLTRLRSFGIEMHIVSADPNAQLMTSIARFGLSAFFRSIAADVHDKTPALTALAQRCGLTPFNAAYVGDTTGDMHSSKRAGLATIAASWGYQSRATLATSTPDAIIDDISELPARLINAY
jgi:phosphoglycolate phosphatase-like HAD superfamily hydrolase